MKKSNNRILYQRANEVLPLGVNSNFRNNGEDTLYVSKAEGPYIWDLDENK